METRAPSPMKVATMALFALSCVGLLLFLWISFGGSVPFAARGYTVRVPFAYADQLPTQAQVRIAGVNVGTVIAKTEDPRINRTIATLEIDRKYAPLHANATALLRTKTILGEVYVAITPGSPNAPPIPDGGMIPESHVVTAVQLDQIYSALNAPTRRAFQQWQEELATALHGNGQNLNDVLGNLPTFAGNATDILHVLDVEQAATQSLIQNGGTVFAALNQDPPALRQLILTGETTFHTAALNAAALERIFELFPAFLDQSKATMARLQTFALNTDPLIRQLEPVARDLGPTLHSVRVLAPYLRKLFYKLGPLIRVSRTGLPATADVLNGARPLLAALYPFLEQLNPIIGWLGLHQQLLSDFIANGATALNATTTSFAGGSTGHYLRQFGPVGPETLSLQPNRDANNRGDTYPNPLWLNDSEYLVKNTLGAWDCRNATNGANTQASGNTSIPGSEQACWLQPQLPGAPSQYQIPQLTPNVRTGQP
jgi:phospholipid/cholesterol/gamma-HCH transport system substrate-binding protein